jgi:hypothetical protein
MKERYIYIYKAYFSKGFNTLSWELVASYEKFENTNKEMKKKDSEEGLLRQ